MAIITLTTDFGIQDEYAGLLKAAILSIDATARTVDITHGVDARDVVQAAFIIDASFSYFPAGTIHLVVVDPGVGTERAIIGAEMSGHFFIAPDNGTLGLVLEHNEPEAVVRIENSAYFLERISATFHGRDIMAPVAAHLGRGVPLSRMGPAIAAGDLVTANGMHATITPKGRIDGRVIAIDRFGNLMTNIDVELMRSSGFLNPENADGVRVVLGNRHVVRLRSRYADAAPNDPLALIGSRGYLEIAVNCGSAGALFTAQKGNQVQVGYENA